MASVLILGSGAREHALGRALSPHSLTFLPGNAGTGGLGRNVAGDPADVAHVVRIAAEIKPDLVVVGPEAPLVSGVVDTLRAESILAFGPMKDGARLEGSKAFMKEFCKRHGVPTAAFRVFDHADDAKAYIQKENRPLVVKADGLCAGKGVVVSQDATEALAAVESMMVERAFGDAGARVVIEDVLPGEEASYHVLVSGGHTVALAAAQDHKRVHDGDRGPNTGGMGAYAPAPIVTPEVEARVTKEIIEPVVRGLAADGIDFRGVLFVGLMIEDGVPRVLEFNVRFGDPETSVVLPLIDGDVYELLRSVATGELGSAKAKRGAGSCVTVVLAAEHYPATPAKGDVIHGLEEKLPEGGYVLHAGTARKGDDIVTAGGRVLAVGARAATFAGARKRAYEVVDCIQFRGMHYRKDIGHRALPTSRPVR
jgi:phosphoribosylamine--glycine ligase